MSYVALVFLLCLFSSLHACNARLLSSNIDMQTATKAFHHATAVEKADDTSINSLDLKAATKQYQPAAVTNVKANSGFGFAKSPYQQSRETNKEHKEQAVGSKLGVGSIPQVPEEAKGSDGSIEDIVMMDYAQPHRKPPIHNEKP